MLLFDAGQTQAQICEALGCSQETARYWIAIASSKQAHKWSNYSNHLGGCYNSAVLGRFALLSLNSSPNALFLKILCRTFRANTPYVSVQKLNSSPINKLI
ncbi:hypothetical protein [Nostoc sp.]|uniref:hypothetical protein n=1 Tax=Nostoc sp. TaxID=1180 RepID=UPI003FA5A410